ncbi:hypothetical protein ACFXOD_29140 [Streptomyces sp. NPDC059161]|uniref:hypothetical protein n=1 Tax=Streptomyces sp. NPDC059161 TaxID=3346749 RepID=UPI0036C0DB92
MHEHSRYKRRIAERAVGGRGMAIELSVSPLYCESDRGPRATFVEQVEGLTERYQRRTPAARGMLQAVAATLAGRAGARLAVLRAR